MGYFNFNNKQVYYKEFGTGIPLLFLHGNTASSNMFAGIAEKYKNCFKVILIDFLGHGKSDRLNEFPIDLWFNEAEQVIEFLRKRQYSKVNIIGSSGGALVAINVALEAPELINKVIADSFEGEKPINAFTENVKADRDFSKHDENTKMFYACMHGSDWEQVVDNDTNAIIRHEKEIGVFFHKPLQFLKADILLTGSEEDEFVSALSPDYYKKVYGELIEKIGHGKIHLFNTGGHPAMLTNSEEFYHISMDFFKQ
ncbi:MULTISPECIES: alpha/beta fold hydrolase [unclassified Sedimentibacter]|uniref:alpha/beta fold hydrolase n=1 Tax=unclassified Sedimentibacter TaxID=2649220 RepID=UPI0027E1DCA9|nr:alpha/beta hydrolase [Sedimentibacter sp. MB35-C1]WMJ79055.1 alpha/beta hydrolase [Sedimentibacter sp. MB35-C1]